MTHYPGPDKGHWHLSSHHVHDRSVLSVVWVSTTGGKRLMASSEVSWRSVCTAAMAASELLQSWLFLIYRLGSHFISQIFQRRASSRWQAKLLACSAVPVPPPSGWLVWRSSACLSVTATPVVCCQRTGIPRVSQSDAWPRQRVNRMCSVTLRSLPPISASTWTKESALHTSCWGRTEGVRAPPLFSFFFYWNFNIQKWSVDNSQCQKT